MEVENRTSHPRELGLGHDLRTKTHYTSTTTSKTATEPLSSKSNRMIFGKRRVTRCNPWLIQDQPLPRLGALVFRPRLIRRSHSGLAPSRADQDPDSRLCVGLN